MKSLKTLAAVAFAALTLSLTGCSKDPEDLIIGTWDETEITVTSIISGSPIEDENGTFTDSMLEEGQTAEMTMNKDYTYVSYSKYATGEESTDHGTWSIADNKLTMTSSDDEFGFGPQVYTIETLTKNDMILTMSESYSESGMNMSYEIKIVCKKK